VRTRSTSGGSCCRAIDKLDKFGPEGVRLLLGKGRMDESGDFTDGAGLSDAQADVVMGFVAANALAAEALSANVAEALEKGEPATSNLSRAMYSLLNGIWHLINRVRQTQLRQAFAQK
jgi:hypothetical protein